MYVWKNDVSVCMHLSVCLSVLFVISGIHGGLGIDPPLITGNSEYHFVL